MIQTFEDSLLDLIIRYKMHEEMQIPSYTLMIYMMNSLDNLQKVTLDKEDSRNFEADPGEMDGDHQSALSSAGWGMDEDYGDVDERN